MKRLFSILLLLICPLSLSACGREPYTKTAVVMDTVVELQADDGEQEQAVEEGIAYLKKLDALASQKDGRLEIQRVYTYYSPEEQKENAEKPGRFRLSDEDMEQEIQVELCGGFRVPLGDVFERVGN